VSSINRVNGWKHAGPAKPSLPVARLISSNSVTSICCEFAVQLDLLTVEQQVVQQIEVVEFGPYIDRAGSCKCKSIANKK